MSPSVHWSMERRQATSLPRGQVTTTENCPHAQLTGARPDVMSCCRCGHRGRDVTWPRLHRDHRRPLARHTHAANSQHTYTHTYTHNTAQTYPSDHHPPTTTLTRTLPSHTIARQYPAHRSQPTLSPHCQRNGVISTAVARQRLQIPNASTRRCRVHQPTPAVQCAANHRRQRSQLHR